MYQVCTGKHGTCQAAFRQAAKNNNNAMDQGSAARARTRSCPCRVVPCQIKFGRTSCRAKSSLVVPRARSCPNFFQVVPSRAWVVLGSCSGRAWSCSVVPGRARTRPGPDQDQTRTRPGPDQDQTRTRPETKKEIKKLSFV